MSNYRVDLTNCDRELIHIPGQIQSHGFLIVLDNDSNIKFFSDNISFFLKGINEDLYGKSIQFIDEFLNNKLQPDTLTNLITFGRENNSFEQTNPFQITILEESYYLIVTTDGDHHILEFEPAKSDLKVDVQKMLGRSITQMLTDKKLQNLLDNSAAQVKNVILYDRVMIYRFAKDGHGEVLAESKNDELESWLGLHYPASDIPKQARELYKINYTRLIADVYANPSKIITAAINQQPLNLTLSQLRAVSPIHIQYLKNMGVASSFSISIMYKDELWGLIACHNYTPRFIDYKSRESAKLIGQILSSALEFRQDEENQYLHEIFKVNLDKISKYLQKSTSIEDALTGEEINLLNVVNATGAVLIYEKNRVKLGVTPSDEQLDQLINWVQQNNKEHIYFTENICSEFPAAFVYKDIASGMMLFELSKELEEYVLWFKPEILKTISWAGNPEKSVEVMADGYKHISPRNSFEVWAQTVSGTSENWSLEEIRSVSRLKEEILYAINLKAGAIRLLNEKLRQAYEELDTFSYTISHDLKNPITAIKSYSQLLAMDDSIGEPAKKLVDRIEDRADKMNSMINDVLDYSRIGRLAIQYKKINARSLFKDIINDLNLGGNKNNLKIITGDMPDLYGDPVMISQVFSNLLSNAVKYSQFAKPAVINIEGKVIGKEICYAITDNGLGIASADIPEIFGLFNRMENAKDIEGSGVGLAIVKRIVEKHNAKIWVESQLKKGTTFFVSFKKEIEFAPIP